MGYNEYLKPDFAKAAVAALLLIFTFPFITYFNGTMCIKAPCPSGTAGSIFTWLFLSYSFPVPPHIYSIDFPMLLVGSAICYLLSCRLVQLFAGLGRKGPGNGAKPAPAAGTRQASIPEKLIRRFFLWPTLLKVEISLVFFLLCAPFFTYDNGAACPPCQPSAACPQCPATSRGAFIEVIFHPGRTYHLFNVQDLETWNIFALAALGSYIFTCYVISHISLLIPIQGAKR